VIGERVAEVRIRHTKPTTAEITIAANAHCNHEL